MALDFDALQAEVAARGGSHLTTAGGGAAADLVRLKRFINEAMWEVDRKESWDYLLTTTTGVAPLAISDLRRVESVSDVVNDIPLSQMSRRSLMDTYVDLTTLGRAAYWYRSAANTISVYPVSTATLTVRYFKVAPALVNGADVPLMPDEYRNIIVELALRRVYRDVSAAQDAADALAEANTLLEEMRENLISRPEFVPRGQFADDD